MTPIQIKMTKHISMFFSVLCLMLIYPAVCIADGKTAQQIYAECAPASGIVYFYGDQYGSCFLVDETKGYVVTCYHVIANLILASKGTAELNNAVLEQNLKVSLGAEKTKHSVEIMYADPANDFCILKLKDWNGQYLHAFPLSPRSSYNIGEQVYAIGAPLKSDRVLAQGIVSSSIQWFLGAGLSDNENNITSFVGAYRPAFLANMGNLPGMSGSAVLDNNGQVIGIWYGGTNNSFTMVRPIRAVKVALKQIAQGKASEFPKVPYIGAFFRKIDQMTSGDAQKYAGLYVYETMLRSPSNPQELFEPKDKSTYLLKDDIITRITHGYRYTNVETVDDLSQVLSNLSIGEEVVFDVLRMTQPENIRKKISVRIRVGDANQELRNRQIAIQIPLSPLSPLSKDERASLAELPSIHESPERVPHYTSQGNIVINVFKDYERKELVDKPVKIKIAVTRPASIVFWCEEYEIRRKATYNGVPAGEVTIYIEHQNGQHFLALQSKQKLSNGETIYFDIFLKPEQKK